VATDLVTGEEVRIDDGPLRLAVQASAAIPAMVPPVDWRGAHLVDGGVVAEVPVAAAASIGRPVIAVDVGMALPEYHADDLLIHTLVRTQMLTTRLLRAAQMRAADVALRPEVGATSWAEWERRDEFEEAGRKEALAAVRDGRI
jgi:NTE family protein